MLIRLPKYFWAISKIIRGVFGQLWFEQLTILDFFSLVISIQSNLTTRLLTHESISLFSLNSFGFWFSENILTELLIFGLIRFSHKLTKEFWKKSEVVKFQSQIAVTLTYTQYNLIWGIISLLSENLYFDNLGMLSNLMDIFDNSFI